MARVAAEGGRLALAFTLGLLELLAELLLGLLEGLDLLLQLLHLLGLCQNDRDEAIRRVAQIVEGGLC